MEVGMGRDVTAQLLQTGPFPCFFWPQVGFHFSFPPTLVNHRCGHVTHSGQGNTGSDVCRVQAHVQVATRLSCLQDGGTQVETGAPPALLPADVPWTFSRRRNKPPMCGAAAGGAACHCTVPEPLSLLRGAGAQSAAALLELSMLRDQFLPYFISNLL